MTGIGVHLHQYAGEMAWREDNRRKPSGAQSMKSLARHWGTRSVGSGQGIGSESS